ncbi:hypothetical protein KEU06_13785 [Pseudaminobacter sp. 19-2017]|uniref:Uncharacterized protein n=1 Tax=Pseudaminobacter soli (ex Zhang et al. 2022) TaxID=2831468 RepID=A0A942DXK2_9HYPH|nr:hypothetical protein [Pseudaminobacter soli]MBS3649679.1 hypothetical protein [Pseudaminobacter soli]
MNEDPSTRTRAQDPGNGKDGQDCAAPTAPLSAPLTRADAGTAQDNFEELWCAYYPRRGKNKKEARAAYTTLNPGPDLHGRMVEAAREWQASWAAQNNPDAPRRTLAKWIEREEYECDPPTAYKPKERKAPKVEPAVAANENDNVPDFMVGSPKLWPAGRYVGEFIDGDIDRKGGDEEVTLAFLVNTPGEHDGKVFEHRFYTQAFIESYQREGQATLESICAAIGLNSVSDTDDILFKPLQAIANGKTVSYLPIPAEEAA